MIKRSPISPFILALALCSIMLFAAYALAQTTSDDAGTMQQQQTDQQSTIQSGTDQQLSTDQDATQPAAADQPQTGTTPAGAGAGPSEAAPEGSVTVPEGQPCPPGTEPAQTQPSQPAGAGTGTTTEQEQQAAPEGSITVPEGQECPPGYVPAEPSQPAGTGAGTVTEEETVIEEQQVTPAGERAGMMQQRRAGYGAGAYYQRGYLPAAGVDFGSLAMLGSTMIGAGLVIRRRKK